jgi:hypothetical protein
VEGTGANVEVVVVESARRAAIAASSSLEKQRESNAR